MLEELSFVDPSYVCVSTISEKNAVSWKHVKCISHTPIHQASETVTIIYDTKTNRNFLIRIFISPSI